MNRILYAILSALFSNICFAQIAPLPSVTGELAGGVSGKVEVSDLGALNYSIPLAVPPGIGGMEPKLSLSYSGVPGDGLLGAGWAVNGFSVVTRCPATVATDGTPDPIDYDSQDKFCLDGQRLMVVTGTYGAAGSEYRTEIESFSKVVANGQSGSGPQSFTVYTRDGRIVQYGATSGSRMVFQGSSSVTAWMISSMSDRMEKRIEYSYSHNTTTQERLPTRIDYTVVNGVAAVNRSSVRFEYEDRAMPHNNFASGSFVSAIRRVSKINMWNGDTKTWEYRFGYSLSEYAKTDRLLTITECDGSGTTCLPPTELTWGVEPTSGQLGQFATLPQVSDLSEAQYYNPRTELVGDWDADGKSDIGRYSSQGVVLYRSTGTSFTYYRTLTALGDNTTCAHSQVIVGDWNADGRSDFGRACSGGYVRFYLNNEASFSHFTDLSGLQMSEGGGSSSESFPFAVADWNNDGRTDVGRALNGTFQFFVATSTGFVQHSSFQGLTQYQGFCQQTACPVLVGDWNGDGFVDIARVKAAGQGSRSFHPYINQLGTWTSLPVSYIAGGSGESVAPTFTGDWNGDGLTDIGTAVANSGPFVHFYISNGYDFNDSFYVNFSTNYQPFPIFTGDWNGDGITDIGQFTWSGIHLRVVRNRNAYPFGDFTSLGGMGTLQAMTYPVITGDWTGDGIPDFARFTMNSTQFATISPSFPFRLAKIKDGFGSETRISYKPLTDSSVYTKGTGATYPVVDSIPPYTVVSSVGLVNSLGSITTTEYRYEGLKFENNGRGISGFNSITSTEVGRGISTKTTFRQDYPFTGTIASVEKRLANNSPLSRRSEIWTEQSLTSGRRLLLNTFSMQEEYELDGSLTTREGSSKTYNAYGNMLTETVTHLDGFTQATTYDYQHDSAHWLIGLVTRTTVTATAPNQAPLTRTTSFEYSVSPTDFGGGLVVREVIEPDYSQYRVDKVYTYDAVGNRLTTEVSGSGITTHSETVAYDSSFRYPVTLTNAIGHVTQQEFDLRSGKIRRQTEPSGLITEWEYDAFGRSSRLIRSDGTEARTLYFKADPQNTIGASYIVRTDSSGQPPVILHYDALGREIRKETRGFDGQVIFVDRVYNEVGELTHVSDPYFSSSTPLWQISEYDARGRVTQITEPGNIVSTLTYDGLVVTVTDPNGGATTSLKDARGRVITVTDSAGGVLGYEYDSYGNPTLIVDAADNVTSAAFDLRGNRIELNDPNTGITTYTYDVLGRVLSQTNAKAETVSYTYDLLGRVSQLTTPDGTTTWTYDSAPSGIGKLTSVVDPFGFRLDYQYDSFGRVVTERRTIGGVIYDFTNSYDQYSRPVMMTYPNGFKIQRLFNSFGFLSQIRRATDKTVLWEELAQNARGQMTSERLGNGITTSRAFVNETGFIQSSRSLNAQGSTLQYFTFQFDTRGNLTQRRDSRLTLQEDFTYDSLNRVTSSTVMYRPTVTFAYDAVGNITARSDVGTYLYNGVDGGPHAVTSIVGPKANQYDYDAAGNRVTDLSGTMDYRYDGRLRTVLRGSLRFEYQHDPDGARIAEERYQNNVLSERKIFASDLFERIDSGSRRSETVYIPGPDGLFALSAYSCTAVAQQFCSVSPRDTSTVRTAHKFLLRDHLGSMTAVTDATGKVLEYLSFDAWGLRRDPLTWAPAQIHKSSVSRGFTGHIHDNELGLIHMNAREYDPTIGRFLSPDALVQAPYDMQSLNRYSYVLNNPLSLTDPSGHFSKKFWKRLRMLLRTAIIAAVSMYVGPQMFALLGGTAQLTINSAIAALLSGAASSVASGIASAIVYGYSIGDGIYGGLKGAPSAAARSFANWGIGGLFENPNAPLEGLKKFKVVAHGVSNGTVSAIGGGRFQEGFLNGSLGSLGGEVAGLPGAIVGGATASAISGGKFVDGIIQSSFVYLYNDLLHESADYLGHLKDIFNEPGSFEGSLRDVDLQYRRNSDLYGVLMDFPTTHPTYTATVEYTALGLTFVQGGILTAGLKIPRAIEILSVWSGGGAATLGMIRDGPSAPNWCDYSAKGLDNYGAVWATRATKMAAAGRIVRGHSQYLQGICGMVDSMR